MCFLLYSYSNVSIKKIQKRKRLRIYFNNKNCFFKLFSQFRRLANRLRRFPQCHTRPILSKCEKIRYHPNLKQNKNFKNAYKLLLQLKIPYLPVFHELATNQYGTPSKTPQPTILTACPPK